VSALSKDMLKDAHNRGVDRATARQ
jgi:hypothetical protein